MATMTKLPPDLPLTVLPLPLALSRVVGPEKCEISSMGTSRLIGFVSAERGVAVVAGRKE